MYPVQVTSPETVILAIQGQINPVLTSDKSSTSVCFNFLVFLKVFFGFLLCFLFPFKELDFPELFFFLFPPLFCSLGLLFILLEEDGSSLGLLFFFNPHTERQDQIFQNSKYCHLILTATSIIQLIISSTLCNYTHGEMIMLIIFKLTSVSNCWRLNLQL